MARNTENKNATKNEPRYKREKCKVLSFNEKTKELDIEFKGYGIRLYDASKPDSEFVFVKYRGEIGKPNFQYKV